MVPCPDPNCEGENKPRAKFCSECGRPLSTLSRASTPAMTPFSPQSHAYSPMYQQSPYLQQGYYGQQQPEPAQAPIIPDPLERNKGCPLATFGFGGKLCLVFPSKLNSQDANAKIMPGLVQMKHVNELVLPDASPLTDFAVGPVVLDASVDITTKQQDAIAYMNKRIDGFHSQLETLEQGSVGYYHLENKALLWQLICALIENKSDDSYTKETAIYHLMKSGKVKVQENALDSILAYLSQGDRSGALEWAIQEKLWSHGLIIGKTLDEDAWKTVVDQFVEHTLSTRPENEQAGLHQTPVCDLASLRVLYALFSGAGADAVSHFIPKYSTRSIEEQLSEWRETLTLILANRPNQSGEAIKQLGDLLKENKWVDAAEICSIILASTSILPDDNSLCSELIGSHEGDVSAPLDSLYLTELYEFALSLNQQNNVTILPSLQGYKLVHAWWLADAGFIPEASRYLQAIITGLLSYDKANSYLHQGFVDNLKEFGNLIRGSSESSISIDLDSSFQQLETKLNSLTDNGQDDVIDVAAPYEGTTKEAENTVLEPTLATYDHQEPEPTNDTNQSNGYETTVYDSTQYAAENNDYTSYHQYHQDNSTYEQPEQVDQGYGFEYQSHQEQANEWHQQETPAQGGVNEETKMPDLSQSYQHDEPAQGIILNSNEAPSESNKVPGPLADESAHQDTQPATLSATQDYSVPSYDAHGAGEYTMTYDAQDYTSTYVTQDNSQDYVTTTYVAQDYTTTYDAQDYNSTYEAQQDTTTTTEPVQESTSITTAKDHGKDATTHDTYHGEGYSQDPSSTYESQPRTVSETTPPTHDTATSFEAQYATMPTHAQDYTSSYEPSGSYGDEPATLSAYTQEYTPSSNAPELISDRGEEETIKTTTGMEEDDDLGFGNSSTKKSFPTEDKTNEDKSTQQTTSDTPKDGKSTDDEGDEDDKQDRKGWGLFSMFSRASPAPMDKDEKKAVKANLGESSTFYFDEKEGRWVNKNVSDTPAAPAKLPPPPKSTGPTPQPTPAPLSTTSAASPPPSTSMPPKPTADPTRPPLQDLMNTPPPTTARRGPASGKKKPMRSRYVDVFNAPT
ncbi:Sec23-binding domain of Sec16-domain-containing protein [Chlamydoabsidia padenii]|nr:Sec23-binding domain of Sec16-domain-containing protein [Chlamydoabsidia padenii]